jgi:hypothetical protein
LAVRDPLTRRVERQATHQHQTQEATMALDDDAVVIAKEGHIYVAPTGTPDPVAPTAPASPWVEVGHSSADSPLSLQRSGGDTTTKGTWQKSALRSDVAPVTYSWVFGLLQQDELAFKLYFGGGAVDGSGDFVVPDTPAAQEMALFIRVIDGANEWPRYAPKVGIIGSDNMEDSTEDFTGMPVTATILTPDTEDLAGLFRIKVAS